jgi:hypothetical protein
MTFQIPRTDVEVEQTKNSYRLTDVGSGHSVEIPGEYLPRLIRFVGLHINSVQSERLDDPTPLDIQEFEEVAISYFDDGMFALTCRETQETVTIPQECLDLSFDE